MMVYCKRTAARRGSLYYFFADCVGGGHRRVGSQLGDELKVDEDDDGDDDIWEMLLNSNIRSADCRVVKCGVSCKTKA